MATRTKSYYVEWEDLAGWLWAPIAGLSGLVLFLAKMLWNLLSKDWRNRQDKIDNEIAEIKKDLAQLTSYVHVKNHEIINMLNEKNLKDSIVDEIHEKMTNIEFYLKNK